MGPHGWDRVVGALQSTDTFKSLGGQRQTAHLWGDVYQVGPVQADRAGTSTGWTGGLTAAQSQKSL